MRFPSREDRMFFYMLLPFAGVVFIVFVLLFEVLIQNSVPVLLREGLKFLTSSAWRPSEVSPDQEFYGVLSPLVGTLYSSLIALILALPTSIALAIFINDYTPPQLRDHVTGLVDLMAGLPTVLYGLWGAFVLAPILKTYIMTPLSLYLGFVPVFGCRPITGFTVFTAGTVLSVMILPFMTSMIRESLASIPRTYREAVYSLGATRYEASRMLVSMTKPAVMAATLLGFGRAAGETIAVSMTIGNSFGLPLCMFEPSYTISSLIANQFANAGFYHYMTSALYAAGLFLLATGLLLNSAGVYMLVKWRRTYRR